jgi:hypothetical protein
MLAISDAEILMNIVVFSLLAGFLAYGIFRLCRAIGVTDWIDKRRADNDYRYVYVPKTIWFRNKTAFKCPPILQHYIQERILYPNETLLAVIPAIISTCASILSRDPGIHSGRGALLILTDSNLRIESADLRMAKKAAKALNLEHIIMAEIRSSSANSASLRSYIHLSYTDGTNDEFLCAYQNSPVFVDLVNAAIHSYRTLSRRSCSIAVELQELEGLRASGAITEADCKGAKALLVGAPVSRARELATQLSTLHDLYKAGILSESEFNLQKWDILSRR